MPAGQPLAAGDKPRGYVPLQLGESVTPKDGQPNAKHMLAAVMFADNPNAPEIYSKYVIVAKYRAQPDEPFLTLALNVNSDVAVPRFKSRGATNDANSLASLVVEFDRTQDVTGFTTFNGTIGAGQLQLFTTKRVWVHGEIDGGPEKTQTFIGTGTWTMS
jgi:hypothetical protein